MCGFAGFVDKDRQIPSHVLKQTVTKMAGTLCHRGPDDGGFWVDTSSGVALGFRRLAIIDLTPSGHQPMIAHNGRFVIAFNGEIYNHKDIKRELESLNGVPTNALGESDKSNARPIIWKGHSDTEIMLEAIGIWGVEAALRKFTGMFAFALWDREKRELTLARDRMGEKPLYYGWVGNAFIFGSELKALRAFPTNGSLAGQSWEIDLNALCMYLRYSYVPSPYSIYKGI